MQIEIVEFYPYLKLGNKYKGTLHIFVKLNEITFDLRGIYVYRKNDTWFFKIPFGKSFDQDEKKDILFPFFSFTHIQMQSDLMKEIISQGKKYILENWNKYKFQDLDRRKSIHKLGSSVNSKTILKKNDDFKIKKPYKLKDYTTPPLRRSC